MSEHNPSLNRQDISEKSQDARHPYFQQGIGQGSGSDITLRVKDINRYNGVSLQFQDHSVTPDDILIRGRVYYKELRKGLTLCRRNIREEHAFTASSSHTAGLSCIFFLKGQADVRIGAHSFAIRSGRARPVCATGLLKTQQEPFSRTTRQAQQVQQLIVTASPEWLAESGFEEHLGQSLERKLARQGMASQQWSPDQNMLNLIQDLNAPSALMPELMNLHLEARSIDIVTRTLGHLMHNDPQKQRNNACFQDTSLSRHEQIRLQRARDLIISDPGQAFSVDEIARQAGISNSGLQRLFRRAEGCSVFDYVRQVRLDQAFTLLSQGTMSVQEVSTLSGYKNPANFATTFKRRFGISPRDVSSQSHHMVNLS